MVDIIQFTYMAMHEACLSALLHIGSLYNQPGIVLKKIKKLVEMKVSVRTYQ